MTEEAPKDPYAAARANMRSTIKWLAGTFGALAAAILAGTSLSGLGKASHGPPLVIAATSLLVAFVCVCLAVNVCLRLMRSDVFYLSDLEDKGGKIVPREGLKRSDRRELTAVINDIEKHQDDLMAPEYPSFPKYVATVRNARNKLSMAFENWQKANDSEKATDAEKETALSAFEKHQGEIKSLIRILPNLLAYLSYRRFYERIQSGMRTLLVLGIAALICLGVFAFLASGSSSESEAKANVMIIKR